MGAKIRMNQIFSKLQKLWQNRRWADGIRVEYFQGFNTLQLNDEVKRLLYRLGETPENFTGRILLMSMFNDISCGTKDNENNVWQMLDSYLCLQEDLEKDNGHFLILVQRKSCTLWKRTVLKEFGTKLQKGCCWNSLRADVQFSVLRLHCPEVNSKAKDMVNCLYIHYAADQETIETVFRITAQSLRSRRRDVWRVSASRRIRSGSFLENKGKSSESIPTIYSLVWWSVESMFGSRRRSKKEIPVLHWWFRSNCLFPSFLRTFRTQSYWSFITGQCCSSEQFLPAYLPCWMCVQSSFYHRLWIDTWRSKFKQETDSILPACWSYGQKSQIS